MFSYTIPRGAGRSLGKKKKARNGVSESAEQPPANVVVAGPDLDFKIGTTCPMDFLGLI